MKRNTDDTRPAGADEPASKKPKSEALNPAQIQELVARAREKAAALSQGIRPPAAGAAPLSSNPIRPAVPGNPVRPGAAMSATGNPVRPPAAAIGAASVNPIRPVSTAASAALPGAVRPPSQQLLAIQQQIAAKQEEMRRNLASAGLGGFGSTSGSASGPGSGPGSDKSKGGLNVEYHPALMMDVSKAGSSSIRPLIMPKPTYTVRANQRIVEEQAQAATNIVKKELKIEREIPAEFKDPSKNPYFDTSLKTGSAIAPRQRTSRNFKFVEHGKYIEIAEKQRAQAALEKLKRDIAEKIKTTGIEKEIELVDDRSLRMEPPPAVEWWDATFVPGESYDNYDPCVPYPEGDKFIDDLIQHPVPIQPPAEPGPPAPRPLMMTKKERKKMNRQRRQEERKEKQEKIRLGLLPPEKPRVKLSNMMRVYGEQALLNPTLVEAKVRAEIEARKKKHRDLVEASKLTDEQRKEKLRNKLKEDTSLLVHVAVFRIDDLTHAQHRFKVDQNAQQYNLTGAAIVKPGCNVVIVEGGPKGIKAYKKLMLRRIDWTKTSDKAANHNDDDNNGDDDDDHYQFRAGASSSYGANHDDDKPPNRCVLVWEGEVKERSFRAFRFKALPTDAQVREYLTKVKVVHYWDAVRNHIDDGL